MPVGPGIGVVENDGTVWYPGLHGQSCSKVAQQRQSGVNPLSSL
jgi:hypothetical protein